MKPKYEEKARVCYTDTPSCIVFVKTNDVYKDIAEDIKTRFNTSNYELDRPLQKGVNKQVTGLMKDQLRGKIMKELVWLRAKTYIYLTHDDSEDKKAKSTKKCVAKRKLKFEDYRNCLEATQLENKIIQLEKNKVDTDSLNKSERIYKTQ